MSTNKKAFVAELAAALDLQKRLTRLHNPPCTFVHSTSLQEIKKWINFTGAGQHFNEENRQAVENATARNCPLWEWASVRMAKPAHAPDQWVILAVGALDSISSQRTYATMAIAKKALKKLLVIISLND